MARTIQNEEDLLGLGIEEHYDIERKSGRLLDDLGKFRTEVAEAVCALANSGGGHLILGQENNRLAFDGLPDPFKHRPIHEWLNQLIPDLVLPTLSGFRVWPISVSTLPDDRKVVVVEVPDSPFAPHQTKETREYKYREGCNTRRAPHFYLEALRSRLIAPILKISGCEFHIGSMSSPSDERPLFRFSVSGKVQNEGRIACHRWAIKYEFSGARNAPWTPHDGWVGPTDEPIFHLARKPFGMEFGLPMAPSRAHIQHFPDQLEALTLRCFAISEHGPGEPFLWPLAPSITTQLSNEIVDRLVQWIQKREQQQRR